MATPKKPTGPYRTNDLFRRIASHTSHGVGSPWAFIGAIAIVTLWAATGPVFHFSDTWQLVINTSTTIVTFLMVFLIQNTQNRDSHAIHLKLDELIRADKLARNQLMCLERLTDGELKDLQDEFDRLASDKIAARSERTPKAHSGGHQEGVSKISSRMTSARSSRAT